MGSGDSCFSSLYFNERKKPYRAAGFLHLYLLKEKKPLRAAGFLRMIELVFKSKKKAALCVWFSSLPLISPRLMQLCAGSFPPGEASNRRKKPYRAACFLHCLYCLTKKAAQGGFYSKRKRLSAFMNPEEVSSSGN
jgi:hypothetical protein